MKIQISAHLEKFRISGKTRSSLLSDNVLRYHQAAAVPFGEPHLLQFSADSVTPYDSCMHQPYSFSFSVKPLHTAAFKAQVQSYQIIYCQSILTPLSCLNCPLYLGYPALFCLPSIANAFLNTFLMHPIRHALSFFSIFIVSYNLSYGIIFVYFE